MKIFDLSSSDLSDSDVLVMGTDGLWDVLSNAEVRAVAAAEDKDDHAPLRVDKLARKLVARTRGERAPEMYWEMEDGRLASGDDITAVVVNLKGACRK